MSDGCFSVRLLEPAQAELEEITRLYLELAGPDSARRITERILGAIERLSLFPLSGPAVRDPELRELGYRFTVAEKYVAIYRLIDDTVFIYHVFDGRADYPRLFKDELNE